MLINWCAFNLWRRSIELSCHVPNGPAIYRSMQILVQSTTGERGGLYTLYNISMQLTQGYQIDSGIVQAFESVGSFYFQGSSFCAKYGQYQFIPGKGSALLQASRGRVTHIPNIMAALGTTRNRCGVSPPYNAAIPSSLKIVLKHCARPVYLIWPFCIGACRNRVRTTS